jgi:hypothetical protein
MIMAIIPRISSFATAIMPCVTETDQLRYETPAVSELLVANLLAPANGANLSQNISQQEYSRFF